MVEAIKAMVIINGVEKETERAVLVAGACKVWLPKSQITLYRHKVMGFLNVYMPFWLAERSGLLRGRVGGAKMYRLYYEPREAVDFNEFEAV